MSEIQNLKISGIILASLRIHTNIYIVILHEQLTATVPARAQSSRSNIFTLLLQFHRRLLLSLSGTRIERGVDRVPREIDISCVSSTYRGNDLAMRVATREKKKIAENTSVIRTIVTMVPVIESFRVVTLRLMQNREIQLVIHTVALTRF